MSMDLQSHFNWTGRQDLEDGPMAVRFYNRIKENGKRALIGFASDAGVQRNLGRPGAALAPDAIRTAARNLAVPHNAGPFVDLGDIRVEDDALEAGHTLLSLTLDQQLRLFDRILILGGGHETAYGGYAGLKIHYPDHRIGIVNLDAHLDLRVPGDKGVSSGTPFYQMRMLDPKQFDYLCLGVAEESNTDALFQRAEEWDVGIVSDHALIANPKAADAEISKLIARNDLIYLTIDLDVLPHYQMPGVSAPASRGVPLSTIERLVQLILELTKSTGKHVPVADIVEYSPALDQDDVGARTAACLARQILLCP
ncbi:MAG: formimidoylglutamase [Hellea sp.]|nr:formimidoylglutamase [Hellea sp.]